MHHDVPFQEDTHEEILDYRLPLMVLSINGEVQGMFKIVDALAGNWTRVNCMGSSYAGHYTTNAYD